MAKKGVKFSEEHKKKLSEAKLGHEPWHKGKTGVYSKDALEKMSKAKKGQKLSKEHIEKVSKALTGKKRPPRSKEWQERLTASIKKSHNTPEMKKKFSESHKGREPWNLGKKTSPEVVEKLRKSHLGIKLSDETKNRIGIAVKKRFEDPKERERQKQIRLKMKIPTKDTVIEIVMQKLLRDLKIHFTTNRIVEKITQADIFIEPNICIFLDGNFYHANPKMYPDNHLIWKKYKNKPERRAKDIRKKDEEINRKLRSKGYTVIRFWESDIHENPEKCVKKVLKEIET
ncbi:very short patch repair endonuclease [Candidatus Nitrosopelagicus sp.]|nr:very short patch repair endonuclease [Candidatus Nitrosopelagicus sp.]